MMEMRETGPVRTRREGAVLEVTLDRPKANAIDLVTSRIMPSTVTMALAVLAVCRNFPISTNR